MRSSRVSRLSEVTARPDPGDLDVSDVRSDADWRCEPRAVGPDKSGNSLAYASVCGPSLRAGAASKSADGFFDGPDVPAPGAAVPDMNRFSRASTPAGGPVGRGSLCGSAGRCADWAARAAPRCQGGESAASGARAAGGVARCEPARSTEPSPLRVSPCLGAPGSLGEVTPTPYISCAGRPDGGSRIMSGRAESSCPALSWASAPNYPDSQHRRLPRRLRRRLLRRCARWLTVCRPHPGSSTERPWSAAPPCAPGAPRCG